jgi:starch phosphorylase
MWHGLWPETAGPQDVPITHVTNGVHIPSWIGPAMRSLLDRHLGEDWITRSTDPATWAGVDEIPAQELWAARREQRAQLVDYVRDRAVSDRLGRDEPVSYAQSAAEFDPDALTIGFARRLATYKRLDLLVQDVGRALEIVGGERPVQLVIAGKAHPRDDDGKRLVQGIFAQKMTPGFAARVVYLDDYDMRMARWLVRGCDVWVNLPRPPLEASGTSGMKSAVNGGLNLSVLDGWWAEAYDGTNGWSLSGAVDHDHGAQDARDGAELLRLLEAEIVPAYYDRDDAGIPQGWLARVRASLRTNGPAFSAGRMLEDYERRVYSTSSSSA